MYLFERKKKLFLFADILRYTQKTSVDYKALEAAIVSIQDVMAHINEDKRRTEGQVALFDIFNDIENCPVRHACYARRFTAVFCAQNWSEVSER